MTEEEIRRIASEPQTSYQEAGAALDAALALLDKLRTTPAVDPEGHRPVNRSTRWKCPEGVHDLDDMLDNVEVDQLGEHDGDEREPKGWWAVSTGDDGDVALFANEADAFRFRLDLINYWLNG